MFMFLFTFCVDLICIIQYLFTFEFTNCRQAASVLCNTVRHAYTTPTNLTIRTATATTRTHIESLKQYKTNNNNSKHNNKNYNNSTARTHGTLRLPHAKLTQNQFNAITENTKRQQKHQRNRNNNNNNSTS